MRRKLFSLLPLLLVALGAALYLFLRAPAVPVQAQPADKVQAAFTLLQSSLSLPEVNYLDLAQGAPAKVDTQPALPLGGEAALDYRGEAKYTLTAAGEGWYELYLSYRSASSGLSDYSVSVTINGAQDYAEMSAISLPLYWRDETKDFPVDSYGDETAPRQIRVDQTLTTPLYSNMRTTAAPLRFFLREGENEVIITNLSGDGLILGTLCGKVPKALPDYALYRAQHEAAPQGGSISINSLDYESKNSSQLIFGSENNAALTPHDVTYKKLNTLIWTEPGMEAMYRFTVKEAGNYMLALHYQNDRQELDAFMSVLLDGEAPFAQCLSQPLGDTGSRWENHVFSDENGQPYFFYLPQGEHTLALRLEMEPVMQAWRYARLLAEHVTRFSLDITKIAGTDTDLYRTWKMTKYIPEIPDYLAAYETLIAQMKVLLKDDSYKGDRAAILAELDKAMQFVAQVSEYPDEIALYIKSLTGRDNSMLVSLSTFTTALAENSLALDMIYLSGDGNLPPAQAGLLGDVGNWVSTLASSFTADKYKTKRSTGDGELTVWVNRALTHVDVLQKMVDTDFTARTGIRVKLSAMPEANKLTLSAAANETPDIALGLGSYMPFDLSSRGALLDLTQFPDFWQVAGRFAPGAMVPYVFNEGVYAIPETMDFNALIYRTDILDSLGLAVPDTWQDVTDMLPQLQRYGMNFYHNIAYGVGYKWFYQTTPLIYQHGGQLYTEDGTLTAIDQPNSVKGIQALGNLFITYSLDKQVASFFNYFRYSVLPIGIVDAADYILIKNGAPELQGRWALAMYPGVEDESGQVQRWYVSNGQGGVIFKASPMKEEAWEFMKWWTGTDTQSNYCYNLRSTYGKAFLWLSANLAALADAPIARADKDVILDMAAWLRDVPRSPGQYMVERSISDIWNSMIDNGYSAQVAADEKVIPINREIRKKLRELGFYDEQGNMLKPYVVHDVTWIREQIEKARGESK